jgi:hypothetical protein
MQLFVRARQNAPDDTVTAISIFMITPAPRLQQARAHYRLGFVTRPDIG